jgi:hypothetical protein
VILLVGTTIERGGLSLEAAQRPIGHANGWMARPSDAPGLILTAEDAATPSIAVAVWTAAA